MSLTVPSEYWSAGTIGVAARQAATSVNDFHISWMPSLSVKHITIVLEDAKMIVLSYDEPSKYPSKLEVCQPKRRRG